VVLKLDFEKGYDKMCWDFLFERLRARNFSAKWCGWIRQVVMGGTMSVNTKNWYREETDMWAEFGRRAPFGKGFSSKHSVEASVVRSAPSFGRRTVPRVKVESIRGCVMTWIEYKERDELMTGTRRT
jgi:hypothetical protein